VRDTYARFEDRATGTGAYGSTHKRYRDPLFAAAPSCAGSTARPSLSDKKTIEAEIAKKPART